jgi:choline monooxygenase
MFEIDPDIRKARTLPAEIYSSAEVFETAKNHIFRRSWQLAARAEEVSNLHPLVLLEGYLDIPLVLTSNGDEIRCLSNVCTHRGKILVEQSCRANGIRCGYHGRKFSLDGKFVSMPEFEGVEDFPSEDDNLREFQAARLGPLIFASIDPAEPFEEVFAPVLNRLQNIDLARHKFAEGRSQLFDINAHWALYCENYLEGFHIPYVHAGLNAVVDYGSYVTETDGNVIIQTGYTDNPADAFDFDGKTAAIYFFVFPNLMLNFYPWGLSVNVVRPISRELTVVEYLTFVSDETRFGLGAGADLATVEVEDQRVVASVHRGVFSGLYDRGRYSPTREQGTHHFHRLIAERFAG